MAYSYSKKYDKEKTARALGRALAISLKKSVEICDFIRGRNVKDAEKILEEVIAKKRAVPFKKFTGGAGHKKGPLAGGKYPVKASKEILKILKLVEANAAVKNFDVDNLIITHIAPQKAESRRRYGRNPWRKAKSTHIEIYVEEGKEKKAEKEKKPKEKEEEKKKKELKEEKKTIGKESEKEEKELKKAKKQQPEQRQTSEEKVAELVKKTKDFTQGKIKSAEKLVEEAKKND